MVLLSTKELVFLIQYLPIQGNDQPHQAAREHHNIITLLFERLSAVYFSHWHGGMVML